MKHKRKKTKQKLKNKRTNAKKKKRTMQIKKIEKFRFGEAVGDRYYRSKVLEKVSFELIFELIFKNVERVWVTDAWREGIPEALSPKVRCLVLVVGVRGNDIHNTAPLPHSNTLASPVSFVETTAKATIFFKQMFWHLVTNIWKIILRPMTNIKKKSKNRYFPSNYSPHFFK